MAQMQVHLVAVERQIWSGEAQLVIARTTDGDIGVMPGHAPLLAQLQTGFAAHVVLLDGSTMRIAVHGGFLSVTPKSVTILAEDAQMSTEIDVAAARHAYQMAMAEGAGATDERVLHAQAQLLAAGEQI